MATQTEEMKAEIVLDTTLANSNIKTLKKQLDGLVTTFTGLSQVKGLTQIEKDLKDLVKTFESFTANHKSNELFTDKEIETINGLSLSFAKLNAAIKLANSSYIEKIALTSTAKASEKDIQSVQEKQNKLLKQAEELQRALQRTQSNNTGIINANQTKEITKYANQLKSLQNILKRYGETSLTTVGDVTKLDLNLRKVGEGLFNIGKATKNVTNDLKEYKKEQQNLITVGKKMQSLENKRTTLLKSISAEQEKAKKALSHYSDYMSSSAKNSLSARLSHLARYKNSLISIGEINTANSKKLDKLSLSFDRIKTNVGKASLAITEATKAFSGLDVINKANASFDKANFELLKYEKNLANLKRTINNRSKTATDESLKEATEYYRKLEKFTEAAKKEVKSLQEAQRRATAELLEASKKKEVSESTLRAKTNALRIATDNLNNALKKEKYNMAYANEEIKKHSAALSENSKYKWAVTIAKRATAYLGVYQALSLVTQGFREAIKYSLEFDKSVRVLSAVSNVSISHSKEMERQLAQLTFKYGGTLESINKVASELARAGVKAKDLVQSTAVIAKLAALTGDTIESSTGALVTYLHVFGKGADSTNKMALSVKELGGKLAYMANESKMTTEDIGTFSNYALAAAKAAGATVDMINAMGVALTNAGNTTSTAGTSVRKFFFSLQSSAANVQKFFKTLGVSQQQLVADIAKGGEASNRALIEMLKTFKKFNPEQFAKATADLPVRLQAALKQFYQTTDSIISHTKGSTKAGVEELDKAKIIMESMSTTWERLGQIMTSVGSDIVDGALVPITEMLTGVLDKSDDSTKKMKQFFDVIVGGATAAGIAIATVTGGLAIASSPAILAFLATAGPILAAVAAVAGAGGALAVYSYNANKNQLVFNAKTEALKKLKLAYKEYLSEKAKGDKSNSKAQEEMLVKMDDAITKYREIAKISKEQAIKNIEATSTPIPKVKNGIHGLYEVASKYAKKMHITYQEAVKIIQSGKIPLDGITAALEARNKAIDSLSKKGRTLDEVKGNRKAITGLLSEAEFKKEAKRLTDLSKYLKDMHATALKDNKSYEESVVSTLKTAISKEKEVLDSQYRDNKIDPTVYSKITKTFKELANAKTPQEIAKIRQEWEVFSKKVTTDSKKFKEGTEEATKTSLKTVSAQIERSMLLAQNVKKINDTLSGQREKTKITYLQHMLALQKNSLQADKYRLAILNSIIPTLEKKKDIEKYTNERNILQTKIEIKEAAKRLKQLKDYIKAQKDSRALTIAHKKYESELKDIAQQQARIGENISSVDKASLDAIQNRQKAQEELRLAKEKEKSIDDERAKLQSKLDKSIETRLKTPEATKYRDTLYTAINKLDIESQKQKLAISYKQLAVDKALYVEEQANLVKNGNMWEGMKKAADEYLHSIPTNFQFSMQLMTDAINSTADAFVKFVQTGKLSFRDLANSIIADIVRMEAKQAAVGIVGGLGSVLDSLFNRNVAPNLALSLKGYADGGLLTGGSGVRDDLYLGNASGSPVFAMGGEYILNKQAVNSIGVNTLDHMNNTGKTPQGNVTINIENTSGVPVDMKQVSELTNQNGDKTINIVMHAIETNPDFRNALKGIA